eukprot:TRINITY_DN2298_c0_g2_i1.p2 TRINITY_DN2298_c0_g2~~TRINITY_DN2298_c0_g2_i1.p2  ORF type:complete len:155 (-),score=30.88 TRINITY_DN2298_c0_g2_i1:46-510(-)
MTSFKQAETVIHHAPENFIPMLASYASLSAGIFNAETLKFLAVDAYKNNQYGLAIGYVNAALRTIEAEAAKLARSCPPQLEGINSQLKSKRAELADLSARYTKDNDTIYFEQVVNVQDLALPEPRSVTKLVPYEMPPPTAVPIVLKQGGGCVIQ